MAHSPCFLQLQPLITSACLALTLRTRCRFEALRRPKFVVQELGEGRFRACVVLPPALRLDPVVGDEAARECGRAAWPLLFFGWLCKKHPVWSSQHSRRFRV